MMVLGQVGKLHIQEKVQPSSIVYTDTFRSYNALDVSAFHHLRISACTQSLAQGGQRGGSCLASAPTGKEGGVA